MFKRTENQLNGEFLSGEHSLNFPAKLSKLPLPFKFLSKLLEFLNLTTYSIVLLVFRLTRIPFHQLIERKCHSKVFLC